MGPFLLLDKSTFQGLNLECVKYLTRFYQHIISPILLNEITSNLVKKKKRYDEEKLKEIVRALACKAQISQYSILPDALTMASNELLFGHFIPMNGYQIPREGGINVHVQDLGDGFCYDEHPMVVTLRNWAEGNISETDLEKAQRILSMNENIDLVAIFQKLEKEKSVPKFSSLKEMVVWIDEVLHFCTSFRQEILQVARYVFLDHPGHIGVVMRRWRRMGRPKLRDFAPYAEYFFRVNRIHDYSLLCGFVKRSKKGKAYLDVQYLYYLPFCQVFSSNDNDLMQFFPFFCRKDQVFVRFEDLKTDLIRIAAYLENLTEKEKNFFHEEYGIYPPDLEDSFTAEVCKKFMRTRRSQEGKLMHPSPEDEAKILKNFKAIREAVLKQQTQEGKNQQDS